MRAKERMKERVRGRERKRDRDGEGKEKCASHSIFSTVT